MPTAVILPKQGNSVESCLINRWLKQVGDTVAAGEPICEVETDKASVEVVAPAAGTLLAHFAAEGDDVPVMTSIAAIGVAGEDVSGLAPADVSSAVSGSPEVRKSGSPEAAPSPVVASAAPVEAGAANGTSPRARAAAVQRGVDLATLNGSGPGGLVIERDVQAAPRRTPAAQALGGSATTGTGIGGRITTEDLTSDVGRRTSDDSFTDLPVKGIRRIIAERMRASLAGAAQLTLTATAKADRLQAWRAAAKSRSEALGLPAITINDLILFAVARTLPRFPALNAHWLGDRIRQFQPVHLGMAVDTDKGLLVPVLRDVHARSLAQIATAAKAAAQACQAGKATPDLLQGSTFSVTNVGALGIETFTPVLNTPEVAILGVGAITLRPYQGTAGVDFVPSIPLSLTIDHQAVDGAPAARFLQALVQAIEAIDVLLAA